MGFGFALRARGDRRGRLGLGPADAAGADMRRFLDVAGGVAYRGLKKVATNPQLLLPSLIFPLFFFVAFAGGLSLGRRRAGLRLPVGLHGLPVRVRAAAGVRVRRRLHRLRDRLGLRERLRAADDAGRAEPARDPRRLRARRAGAGGRRSASCCSSSRVASGMQVGGNGVDLFGLIVLALLVNLIASMWAAGVALRLRTIQAGPAMQMPVFIILFLAPGLRPARRCSAGGSTAWRRSTRSPRWSRAAAT